jgi:hypothetical protein
MENELRHFLPEGQSELKDSIMICDDLEKCETCSNFLFKLNVEHIKSFVQGEDFSLECSSLRIVIPFSKENLNLFTLDGIKKLFIDISQRHTKEEKKYVDWKENTSIILVTSFLVEEEVGLCIDILIKPYLDVYKLFFLDIRLDELKNEYPNIQFEFRDMSFYQPFNGDLLDIKISNTEITPYLEYMTKFLDDEQMEDLEFILCWGVFDTKTDIDGNWNIPMLDLNQKSKGVIKPGNNDPNSLGF